MDEKRVIGFVIMFGITIGICLVLGLVLTAIYY